MFDGTKTFKINEYLRLKLEDGETNIHVNGKWFDQCKYLVFQVEMDDVQGNDKIQSIDDIEQKERLNGRSSQVIL